MAEGLEVATTAATPALFREIDSYLRQLAIEDRDPTALGFTRFSVADADPVQFRLDLLDQLQDNAGEDVLDAKRARGVLEMVAEKSGWGKNPSG